MMFPSYFMFAGGTSFHQVKEDFVAATSEGFILASLDRKKQ